MPFTHSCVDFSGDKQHCQTRNLVGTCVLTQDEVEVCCTAIFCCFIISFSISSPSTVGVYAVLSLL